MNEVRTLLENFWICKDTDKETYYRIKRDIPNFQKFIREQLGWKLIHTENLLKLEKRPAHAEPFMGIEEFTEIRDYCILCVILMPDRKYYMKTPDIRNILPQVFQGIFPDISPGRILKKQISRKSSRIKAWRRSIVFTVSLPSAR